MADKPGVGFIKIRIAAMNTNQIVMGRFSNLDSEKMYQTQWKDEPETAANFYFNGKQCGGCSFFAKFDSDWGLCCHAASRHHLETVFEHFTCPAYVDESWDFHSFTTVAYRENVKAYSRELTPLVNRIAEFVTANQLGTVTYRNEGYLLNNNLPAFHPDLGFIAKERSLNKAGEHHKTPPDLAVRIVTIYDTSEELHFEIMSYLQAGTRQVWVVYTDILARAIAVYRVDNNLNFQCSLLSAFDRLDGADILPGFQVPVDTLFRHTS